jgi:hypothetical protein
MRLGTVAEPPPDPLRQCNFRVDLCRRRTDKNKQAKTAHALDHECEENREPDAHAVLARANQLRKSKRLRISQLAGALAPQSFDRLVQLVDLLAECKRRSKNP